MHLAQKCDSDKEKGHHRSKNHLNHQLVVPYLEKRLERPSTRTNRSPLAGYRRDGCTFSQ
jgi:hypothetical protein